MGPLLHQGCCPRNFFRCFFFFLDEKFSCFNLIYQVKPEKFEKNKIKKIIFWLSFCSKTSFSFTQETYCRYVIGGVNEQRLTENGS